MAITNDLADGTVAIHAAGRVRRLIPVPTKHAQSGVEAAKAVLNCRSSDILTQKGPGPLFLQAERPDMWPENLKKMESFPSGMLRDGEKAREDEERRGKLWVLPSPYAQNNVLQTFQGMPSSMQPMQVSPKSPNGCHFQCQFLLSSDSGSESDSEAES